MFVLFRSMVSSLHSLVRSFRSFSLKLDMMCACLAYGLKNELSTQVTLLTREKFLPYCGTIWPWNEVTGWCCKDQDPQNLPTFVVGFRYFRGKLNTQAKWQKTRQHAEFILTQTQSIEREIISAALFLLLNSTHAFCLHYTRSQTLTLYHRQ